MTSQMHQLHSTCYQKSTLLQNTLLTQNLYTALKNIKTLIIIKPILSSLRIVIRMVSTFHISWNFRTFKVSHEIKLAEVKWYWLYLTFLYCFKKCLISFLFKNTTIVTYVTFYYHCIIVIYSVKNLITQLNFLKMYYSNKMLIFFILLRFSVTLQRFSYLHQIIPFVSISHYLSPIPDSQVFQIFFLNLSSMNLPLSETTPLAFFFPAFQSSTNLISTFTLHRITCPIHCPLHVISGFLLIHWLL